MQTLIVILAVVDILVCIALIVLVALQEGGKGGLGSLAGNFETFLDRTPGSSFEEKLKRFTKITAILFAVLSVALYLLTSRVV